MASPDDLDALPPHDRRGFFHAALARVLRPVVEYIEERLPENNDDTPPRWLRPPGAIPESQFLDTCKRCGKCVEACPAVAIKSFPGDKLELGGTPYVDPNDRACVICDDLSCMKVCPSGALQLVDRLAIRMGLAQVDDDRCLRSHGEACTICVDRCPLGATAIRLDSTGRVQVVDPSVSGTGCTGCGVCQQECPTRPVRAIRIAPTSIGV